MKFAIYVVELLLTMTQYADLDLQSLIDLLVVRTKEYDKMLSTRVFSEEEFAQCKRTLAQLHAAIKVKALEEGYNTSNIYPNFPENELTRQSSKYDISLPGDKAVDSEV